MEHGSSRRRRRNKSLRLTDKWLLLSDSLCWKWSARGQSWRTESGWWHWAGVWTDIVEEDWVWWAELNFYGGVLFRCCAPICLATPPATDPFSGGQGKWWMFTGLRWWATIKWVGLWRVGRVTRVLWGGNGTAGCWFVLRVTGSVRFFVVVTTWQSASGYWRPDRQQMRGCGAKGCNYTATASGFGIDRSWIRHRVRWHKLGVGRLIEEYYYYYYLWEIFRMYFPSSSSGGDGESADDGIVLFPARVALLLYL